jgi:hypothetical protein
MAKLKMAVFWVVTPRSLVEVYRRFRGPCCLHQALMMKNQITRRYNPEDNHLPTRRRENLKSHKWHNFHTYQNSTSRKANPDRK